MSEARFDSTTRNQHYVSQAEQRLNAIDPCLDKKIQRIYQFRKEGRDNLRLLSDIGCAIESSLRRKNLFTFLYQKSSQSNFEVLFKEYENLVFQNSQKLEKHFIERTQVESPVFIQVLETKFMGFVRNPHCIKRVLNTFSRMQELSPTTKSDRAAAEQIKQLTSGQLKNNLNRFNVTEDEYKKWLHIILVTHQKDIIKNLIRTMLGSHRTVVGALLAPADEVCLLSDRGITVIESDQGLILEFNLTSNAAVSVQFTPLNGCQEYGGLVFKRSPDSLVKYNQRTVLHCHEMVLAARKHPLGTTLVASENF